MAQLAAHPVEGSCREHYRPATEAEVVGQQMVQEELRDHQKQVSGHGSKARGFLDLTQTAPPAFDGSQPLAPGQQVSVGDVPQALVESDVCGKDLLHQGSTMKNHGHHLRSFS